MSAAREDVSDIIDGLDRYAVSRLWAAGKDTVEIAKAMNRSEAEICRILARLQHERHLARQQGGMA